MKRWLLLSLSITALSGCSTFNSCDDKGGGGWWIFRPNPAEQKLDKGVKEYEEGNYIASMNALQGVLEAKLAEKGDKVNAYKYLAFIHCISSREKLCREYFKKALALDPNFDLTPAEAGHPLWGPAFRSVKGKSAK